ncbi:hypothetical protein Dimus_004210 [Dionaea muscipula]
MGSEVNQDSSYLDPPSASFPYFLCFPASSTGEASRSQASPRATAVTRRAEEAAKGKESKAKKVPVAKKTVSLCTKTTPSAFSLLNNLTASSNWRKPSSVEAFDHRRIHPLPRRRRLLFSARRFRS